MIELVKREPSTSIIRFNPRWQFKALPSLERKLIYGHVCPYCKNVIQALYHTDKPIELATYEQTNVISQSEKSFGEVVKVVPNWEEGGNYKSTFFSTPNGTAERLILKNHVVNWKGKVGDRGDFFEVGERCCRYTALIPLSEKTVMRELASLSGFSFYLDKRQQLTDPESAWIKKWFYDNTYLSLEMKVIEAIGNGPASILILRETIKSAFPSLIELMYNAWDEEVEAQMQAVETAFTLPEPAMAL